MQKAKPAGAITRQPRVRARGPFEQGDAKGSSDGFEVPEDARARLDCASVATAQRSSSQKAVTRGRLRAFRVMGAPTRRARVPSVLENPRANSVRDPIASCMLRRCIECALERLGSSVGELGGSEESRGRARSCDTRARRVSCSVLDDEQD